MAEKTTEMLTPAARLLYGKALTAVEQNNLDYAVELLIQCLDLEPSFVRGRLFLRAAQMKRVESRGTLQRVAAAARAKALASQAQAALRRNTKEAMTLAERALAEDPKNGSALMVLVDAAEAVQCFEISVQTLEHYLKVTPGNEQAQQRLARARNATGAIGETKWEEVDSYRDSLLQQEAHKPEQFQDASVTIEFDCLHCGQHIEADSGMAGSPAACPTCNGAFTVPDVRGVRINLPVPVMPRPSSQAGQQAKGMWGDSVSYRDAVTAAESRQNKEGHPSQSAEQRAGPTSFDDLLDRDEPRSWRILADLACEEGMRSYPDFDIAYLRAAYPTGKSSDHAFAKIEFLEQGLNRCRRRSMILGRLSAYWTWKGNAQKAVNFAVRALLAATTIPDLPGDLVGCISLLSEVFNATGHVDVASKVGALNPGYDESETMQQKNQLTARHMISPEHERLLADAAEQLRRKQWQPA